MQKMDTGKIIMIVVIIIIVLLILNAIMVSTSLTKTAKEKYNAKLMAVVGVIIGAAGAGYMYYMKKAKKSDDFFVPLGEIEKKREEIEKKEA
jgi:uncharacterized membrane-anchored protein